ncbi:MAG: response regulator [Candidatus Omnitrophica bacterium]|nr:response regulator [Candidatus Omnitrophota bacterium]
MAKKKRLLLVDDEVDFAELVRTRLEDNNYEVIVAYDGEDGLEKAEREEPDLIILDIMLPKISGFDVCRKLKIDENFKNIPIIMLSAKFQPNDITFGKAMGADAYITKPFEPQVLIEKIRELLDKKKVK